MQMDQLTEFRTADQIERRYSSTGEPSLDDLLGGGLETGLIHLFYGHTCLRDDVLRSSIYSLLPPNKGGLHAPVVIVDSMNSIDTVKLAEFALNVGLDPDFAFNRVLITRAFNSSQTYDLVINHLESFMSKVRPGMLVLPGLFDIFSREGLDAEKMQQIAHMAARIMTFTLNYGIVTIVSADESGRNRSPRVGSALASYSQVHVMVEQTPARIVYSLTKHPSREFHRASIDRRNRLYYEDLPLDYYLNPEGSGE
jgi:hypothetical protein